MKKYLLFLFVSFLLVGCSSTNILTLSVVQPPVVPIASSVTKVAVLDRSKGNSKMNKIDQVLTMESPLLEKEGAEEVLNGLVSELKLANRFDEVDVLKGYNLKSQGMGIMDKPLEWPLLKTMSEENDVDVIIVLEAYDTDTHLGVEKYVEVQETPRGEVRHAKTDTKMTVSIKVGWRIYKPNSNQIIDQRQFKRSFNYVSDKKNPVEMLAGAVNSVSAVRDFSYQVGQDYAHMVLAHNVRVSRRYYVRGADNFKTGKRLAQTGKWDEAAKLWSEETKNADAKIAGRAYYNMAIINEINGDLDAAIDWAGQSYSKFDNKKALSYLNVLKNRKRDEQFMDELQMK